MHTGHEFTNESIPLPVLLKCPNLLCHSKRSSSTLLIWARTTAFLGFVMYKSLSLLPLRMHLALCSISFHRATPFDISFTSFWKNINMDEGLSSMVSGTLSKLRFMLAHF